MEMASSMEGVWSCYRGGHFNGRRSHVMEVASLKEGEWLLQRQPVMEGE